MSENPRDITFHYPPELFNLLVDAIPLLNRSKKGVLLFFHGAGVAPGMTADLTQRLRTAPEEINKYEIVRTVLERLNAKGEATLRERREVLRRVVEFTNFDTCWANDQLKAKGAVAAVRDIVNQKDAFTRMNQAREQERQERLREERERSKAKQEQLGRIDEAKNEIYALFSSELTPQARGKRLETALNNLFAAYGILIRKSFHIVSPDSDGIVEQIDGVIELKGDLYFVEMKWYRKTVGVPEISQHLVRLMGRAEARGLFISASEYTDPAISQSREFLQQKVMVLSNLKEIVQILEQRANLPDFIAGKVEAAIIHKNPYLRFEDWRGTRTG